MAVVDRQLDPWHRFEPRFCGGEATSKPPILFVEIILLVSIILFVEFILLVEIILLVVIILYVEIILYNFAIAKRSLTTVISYSYFSFFTFLGVLTTCF